MLATVLISALVSVTSAKPVELSASPFLVPERYVANVGERVGVDLRGSAAKDAALIPWTDLPISWLFVRVAGTQENRSEIATPAGANAPALTLEVAHRGVTMVAADFAPVVVTMTRESFETLVSGFATAEAKDKVLAGLPAGKPVRVRRIDAAKTLFLVKGANPPATDAQTAGSKAGTMNELRFISDPVMTQAGGDIQVRAHANYDKAAKAKIIATHVESGDQQEVTTDGSGIALFHVPKSGPWRVVFRRADLLKDDPNADVVVYTATATFSTPEREAVK